MSIHPLSWKSSDGLNFFAIDWKPEKKVRAAVGLVHGLGEHIERYHHVAAALNEAGIAVIGFDQRGHGKSEGPRGHAPSYEQVCKDIDLLLAQLAERYPNIPRFLYGHSMGGNQSLYYGLVRKPSLAGMIVTSPGLEPANPPTAATMTLGKVMSRIAPTFKLPNGLLLEGLARDPMVIEKYRTDPLVHGVISAKLGMDMIANGRWIVEHAAELTLPLLLLQGSKDMLVSPAMTAKFAAAAGPAITYKEYPGYYHELHNEPEKNEVIGEISAWILARLG